jgi:hypothetical protein
MEGGAKPFEAPSFKPKYITIQKNNKSTHNVNTTNSHEKKGVKLVASKGLAPPSINCTRPYVLIRKV